MHSLFASLTVIASASLASAAPFQLERLVIEGETLPGLPGPVSAGAIQSASINSHGQWAISLGTPRLDSPGFISGVLGNEGFRILPGYDPDGSVSPDRTMYAGVQITDSNRLATTVLRFQAPSQSWLDNQLVASAGGGIRDVSVLPDDAVISTIDAGVGAFTLLSEPNGPGSWTTTVVHGRDVVTPVGQVLSALNSPLGYGRSVEGRQAWVGAFSDGKPETVTHGIAVDDQFLVARGEASPLPGFEYFSGGGVRWNASGQLVYGAGLLSEGDGPLQTGSAIFREDGSALVSSLQNYTGLEEFVNWGPLITNFDIDSQDNVLWVAQSFETPGPNHPFPFFRTALMYNDTLVTKMGDVLDDGMVVASLRSEYSLSDDGSWAIAQLFVYDPIDDLYFDAVYRFAIPSPATALLGIGAGVYGISRRRR